MKSFWLGILGFAAIFIYTHAQADTLGEITKRGYIKCGVSQGLAGFSSPDKTGAWRGLDVDFCRALAAATLGDANKVKFTALSAKERFTALQSGEIDILSRNTSWTIVRDASLGVDFVGVIYYDGQGFLVAKKAGVKTAKELNGASICVNLGTTTELNLAD
ncbi:MAG: transporter substrate-binding domain-containing protein, partial [Proteobacteria bacterium]|nr:transporter substrate-binding domain-containing protein [Pseudomonadota bacterium]